jgi:hypothetical protein
MIDIGQLIALLEKRRYEILNSLGDGVASSFDAYKSLVGQRQGLQMALDILNDLLEEKDRDEYE